MIEVSGGVPDLGRSSRGPPARLRTPSGRTPRVLNGFQWQAPVAPRMHFHGGERGANRLAIKEEKMSPNPKPTSVMGYAGRAKWSTVRVETDKAVYVGRIYVPETKKRLSDVLCDERPFINLTEVSINDSETLESFVALNKQFIHTVRILHEGEADVVPIRHRTA
jgi:hypothetical protein